MTAANVSLQAITKRYGGITALDNVDFEVTNEIHALVGHNGAGKSTLVKVLMGAVQPDSGIVLLNGEQVTLAGPIDAQEKGVAMVWQELANFPNLTVAENILMDRFSRMKSGFLSWDQTNERAREFLRKVNLEIDPRTKLAELPLSQQQLVEFAKALSFRPHLLILDEPTSALSMKEQDLLHETVLSLREQGLSLIYITHKIDEIFKLASRVTVLRDGRCVFTRRIEELTPDVIVEGIVGTATAARPEKRPATRAPVSAGRILEIRHLYLERKLHDISFHVEKGEIVGVVGLSGSGISDLGKVIFGIDPPTSGEIILGGETVVCDSPHTAVRLGIGYVPKNRKEEGLIPGMSIADNIALSSLRAISRGLLISKRMRARLVSPIMELTDIKPMNLELSAESFSGGNQQKLVLSRWIANASKLLVLDEPTRGVDVGAIRKIYDLLRKIAHEGVGIVILSSEFEEIHSEVDRIVVLSKGSIVGVLDPHEHPWKHGLSLALKA
jgi:ABC-type sugar transport system ATPase subunit